LLVAAIILYLPANLYPIITVIRFGRGEPSTILNGVIELVQAGMIPLAILVFLASITVPLLKLLGLTAMLIMTHDRSGRALRERTRLYRLIESVGRWSMIDVFMLTTLVALVHMGFIATVLPGPGAVAFAAVVILTMLAARSFDPRIMWDVAEPVTEVRETGSLPVLPDVANRA
jgi:paraquat-inducible protein A